MVNKTSVLIRSFLKKSRAQVIALVLLFAFSSALLNIFVYIQSDYSNNYDRNCEKLETEDLSLVCYNTLNFDLKDEVEKCLSDINYIDEYEIENVITGMGSIEFNGGELDNVMTLASYEQMSNKEIGKYEFLNDIDDDGVVLSYLFNVSAGYQINDSIKFRISGNTYEYKIVGFYNNPTTGTINCPDIVILLTDNLFNKAKEESNPSFRIELNLKQGNNFESSYNSISAKLTNDIPFLTLLDGNNKNTIHNNRYSNATLFEVILSAGSIVMISVLLIIIFISLNNYISNSTRDLGTLKAIGYTSNNIIIPIVFELTLICLISGTIGSLLSYFVIPLINTALESQIGIPYEVEFHLIPLLISVLTVTLMTFITSLLSLIKIKKIAPINAIRENKAVTTKSSKVITLDRTNLDVNSLIGIKGFFSSIGRNIVILIAITAVSFLAGFTCFMYQNVIQDNMGIIELVCGQIADSTLSVYAQNEDALLQELKNNKDVDNYYLYTAVSINPKDYPVLNCFVYEDSDYLNKKTIVIDGRLPEKENEIAINGAYAKRNDLSIGDVLVFENDGLTFNVEVTGISQGAYYSGRDCYILRDTYENMDSLYAVSYYIDLKDNVDIDEFNNGVCAKLPKTIISYINQDKYLQSTAAMYSSILYILAVVISVLSLMIIVFVLYILIYILLKNKRREHGILKSIGYTSNEIMYQTILTIFPTCLIAIIVGLLLSRNGVKDLLSAALNSIGIFRFGRSINVTYLLITGAFLSVFTILYTLILSLPIKKISPHDLFNNE